MRTGRTNTFPCGFDSSSRYAPTTRSSGKRPATAQVSRRLAKIDPAFIKSRRSTVGVVHVIQIRHRDEVEAPVTDWLQEAYELSDVLASRTGTTRATSKRKPGLNKKKARAARKTIAAGKSKRR